MLFDEPYARLLCGRPLRLVRTIGPLEGLLVNVVLNPILPSSMCVFMRARYAEESLERLIEEDIRQGVILSAAMNSFAFHRGGLLS